MIDEKLMERIELAITGSKKINEGYHAACTEYSIQLGPISSMISAKERRVLNISETDIRGQIKECAYFIEVHDKKELNLKEIGDHDILVLRNGKKSRIAFESYQLLIGRAFLCYDIVVGHDDDVARKAYSMLAEKAAMQTRAEAMKQSARRAMKNEKLVKILNKATKNLAGRKAALESGIESIEEAMTAGNVSDEDKQLLADGLEIAKKSIENLVGKPHIHIAGNRGR